MRIAVFGKFPPIQGGVSGDVFEFVEAAAAEGHEVHVVTNAGEAELGVRAVLDDEDLTRLSRLAGSVHVHSTSTLGPRIYVPYANPFLSKLIGLGRKVLAAAEFDAVIGWYLEPYALAAALTVQGTQIPFFVRTAGSDIGRLASHEDLRHAYQIVFERADVLLSGRPEMYELGADPAKTVAVRPCALPRAFRRPSRPLPLDWSQPLAALSKAGDAQDQAMARLYVEAMEGAAFDAGALTIGAYGKVGETKGTYDLLGALEALADERRFNILWLAAGPPARLETFLEGVRRLRRRHPRVTVLPTLAPWRVPEFLARCDIACVLERRFPVTFHAPRLPREVLASGSALVVSREVAAKQTFAANLVHGKNCVIVEEPSDVAELSGALARLLDDAEHLKYVRRHGRYLSDTVEGMLERGNNVLNAVSDLLPEVSRPGSAAGSQSVELART